MAFFYSSALPLCQLCHSTTMSSGASLPKSSSPSCATKRQISTVYDSQPQSFFLSRLPTEIRLQIYQLLLTLPPDFFNPLLRSLISQNHYSSYLLPSIPLFPSLLLVCRQIYAEAHAIPYTSHQFSAHQTLLTKMPYLVNPSRPILSPPTDPETGHPLIRRWHVLVRLDTDPRFTALQAKEAFSNAEELEIEVWKAMYGADTGYDVLKTFAEIRGVKRARVTGRCDDSLKRWLEKLLVQEEGTEAEEWRECDGDEETRLWELSNR